MQDINKCIKETDTDNVTLKKLKELGTKLTGQENVQGETVAEVLDFINANYSGGGSSEPTITLTGTDLLESQTVVATPITDDRYVIGCKFTINIPKSALYDNYIYLGRLYAHNENNPMAEYRFNSPVSCVVEDEGENYAHCVIKSENWTNDILYLPSEFIAEINQLADGKTHRFCVYINSIVKIESIEL